MTSWFRRYLLPGFVFQSIIIGILFVLPLLTIGLYKLRRRGAGATGGSA